jgi:predicted RNA-binding Zn-ribbon protein involved in translation (DUF1610 family)
MSKLIRRIEKEEISDELIKIVEEANETEETETMQVNEPILTSNSKIDLSEVSLGPVKLECNRCFKILAIGRNLGVNLSCPECGNDIFSSKSNFIMKCLDDNIIVKEGDKVYRMGRMIWKIV